jgi:hypothetical protein
MGANELHIESPLTYDGQTASVTGANPESFSDNGRTEIFCRRFMHQAPTRTLPRVVALYTELSRVGVPA